VTVSVYCPGICWERMRKTWETSVKIADNFSKIQIGHRLY
jgi:hypothetical protein